MNPPLRFAKNWNCSDCGSNTAEINEYYMVKLAIWKQVKKPKEMLCIGCLEMQIGRQLKPEDFQKSIWNNGFLYPQSDRLRSRIDG